MLNASVSRPRKRKMRPVEIPRTLGNSSSAGWSNPQGRPSQGGGKEARRPTICMHACTELESYVLCSMRVEGAGITATKVTARSQSREHCSTHRCRQGDPSVLDTVTRHATIGLGTGFVLGFVEWPGPRPMASVSGLLPVHCSCRASFYFPFLSILFSSPLNPLAE